MSERRAELLLATVIVTRSTSFVFNKLGLGTMSAFNLLAVRFLLDFLLLMLLFHRKLRHVKRRTVARGALLGGLFFLVMSCEMFALRTVNSGTVSLLENMAILFVPLLESLLTRTAPRPVTLISAAVALVGVALLTSGGGAFRIGVGECIALGAAPTTARTASCWGYCRWDFWGSTRLSPRCCWSRPGCLRPARSGASFWRWR